MNRYLALAAATVTALIIGLLTEPVWAVFVIIPMLEALKHLHGEHPDPPTVHIEVGDVQVGPKSVELPDLKVEGSDLLSAGLKAARALKGLHL